MLQWRGSRALPEARLVRLEATLRDRLPAVRSLAAEFVHFVDTDGELTEPEHAVLGRLLEDGAEPAPIAAGATRLWVVPRLGTISPWSSKATDIAKSCGLARVRRIERGVVWSLDGAGSARFEWVSLDESLQWAAFRRLVGVLRDRGNDVFVVVGPFNEHMMAEENKVLYRRLLDGVVAWLAQEGIASWAPPALPSDLYADASHPLTEGYARLAKQVYSNGAFQAWLAE